MTSLDEAFAAAKADGRAALVGYLPAGFPSVDGAIEAIETMVAAGVDIVEVGLPYTDPLMDGPTIQAAVEAALRAGVSTADVLRTVEAAAKTGAAAVVMTYWNPVERYGVNAFAQDLVAVGAAGAITPDLIPDEAGPWIEATDAVGLGRVFLIAPSSSDARIALTANATTGFIYAASTMGVTGARTSVSNRAEELVNRARPHTTRPIAVGLGVSTGAQAAEVARFADGVIVGSALVRCLLDAPTLEAGLVALRRLTEELAAGVRGELSKA
jgi:tryptophan synthase alpha chain